MTAGNEEVAALADGIVWTLRKATEGGYINERRYRLVHDDLVSTNDAEYLAGVQSFASRLAAGGFEGRAFLTSLMSYVSFSDEQAFSLMVAHHDEIIKEANLLPFVAYVPRSLLVDGIVSVGEDGRIDTLHAHFKAKNHYDQQLHAQYGSEDPPKRIESYRANKPYAAAVERHASRIDHLLAYRDMRKISVGKDGNDLYDEEDFLQYLAHGAVGGGWL